MSEPKKPGRPALPEDTLRKVYPLRLSPKELDRYQEAADKDKKDLPKWIRAKLDEAANSALGIVKQPEQI